MVQRTPLIIHIQAPRVHDFLTTLNPAFGELNYDEDLHEKYLVMDWPSNGQYVIMNEDLLRRNFDMGRAKPTWFFNPITAEAWM